MGYFSLFFIHLGKGILVFFCFFFLLPHLTCSFLWVHLLVVLSVCPSNSLFISIFLSVLFFLNPVCCFCFLPVWVSAANCFCWLFSQLRGPSLKGLAPMVCNCRERLIPLVGLGVMVGSCMGGECQLRCWFGRWRSCGGKEQSALAGKMNTRVTGSLQGS